MRTTSLQEKKVWSIGDWWVAPTRGQNILARGDVVTAELARFGLVVAPDEPPPRHANVGGWPTQKEARKSVAQRLAERFVLVPR